MTYAATGLLTAVTVVLYTVAFVTVVLAAHVPGYESLLETMTREGGFFEWASVLLLLAISGYGLRFFSRYRALEPRWLQYPLLGFSALAFVAAMEELSWGQHLFHFESGRYFEQHNLQQETNLHNLMAPELFSSLIYSSVYLFFVFVPLLVLLLSRRVAMFRMASHWFPQPHVTLIVLYGAAFQAYFMMISGPGLIWRHC